MFKYVHGPDAGNKKITFYISGDANTNNRHKTSCHMLPPYKFQWYTGKVLETYQWIIRILVKI